MSDSHRQATAVNIVVRIRRLGVAWYRLLFFAARHVAWVTAAMRRQQFIHHCHWMLLPNRVLWFESNYDGDVVRYMDTFARIMPWRMRAAWTPTVGFPDMFPPAGFHQWTIDNAYETTSYWSGYPDATTRQIGRALRVLDAAEALPNPDADITPDEFAIAWQRFVAATQLDL